MRYDANSTERVSASVWRAKQYPAPASMDTKLLDTNHEGCCMNSMPLKHLVQYGQRQKRRVGLYLTKVEPC